jgi:hypothetical protein
MNPLGNKPVQNQSIPPQLMKGIKQVKGIMSMANGNPNALLQQMGQNDPRISQVLQMCQGQDLQKMFMSMCQAQGVDPNAVMNELQQ